MLCSSGGHFAKVQGGWEYQGGETRLVSVINYCHMQELQDALHRVSQTMRLDLSSSCGSVMLATGFFLLLQLPCSQQKLQATVRMCTFWMSPLFDILSLDYLQQQTMLSLMILFMHSQAFGM